MSQPPQTNPWAPSWPPQTSTNPFTVPHGSVTNGVPQPPPRVQHHVRSHSIDSGELAGFPRQYNKSTLMEQRSFHQNGSAWSSTTQNVDPFDVAWAAKSTTTKQNNPFSAKV